MNRSERQRIAIKKWLENKGKGTFEFPTAFGKTFTAITAIKVVMKKYPHIRVLVVVPTITLKDQWIEELSKNDLYFNAEVQVINTVIKHSWTCDMLIIDEYHIAAAEQMSQVFDKVKYKLILGLTATFERLDGKHILLEKYSPIIDRVTTEEALINEWISEFKEYQVLINVDDIEEYKSLNREWTQHFEFFQFDFNLAMRMCGPEGWKAKLAYRDELYKGNDAEKKKEILNAINYHSAGFMRTMTKRKSFINNHPKKIEIAKKIMEARPDSKIITFSNNIKMAEALENGENVYTGKTSKTKGRVMIEDYLSGKIKHLHSVKRLIEGFNDPNTSVGIILGMDSSERRAIQSRGRIIRRVDGKKAEIFNIVINDTQELKWYKDSHKNVSYITIDENGLDQVLKGERPKEYKKKIQEIQFRF
jgi:superfamily II DNA or RNA helicase